MCKRQYFYHYYLSWGGWNIGAPKDVQLAYRLKNLMGLAGWVGDTIHKEIETLLKMLSSGTTMSKKIRADILRNLPKQMTKEWLASKKQTMEGNPKSLWLIDHYYSLQVDNKLQGLITQAVECMSNFLDSGLFSSILKLNIPENWLSIEELKFTFVAGTKVWVKIDFIYKDDKDYLVMLDWKTGKRKTADAAQMGIYGCYLRETYNTFPAYKIKAVDVYVNNNPPVLEPWIIKDKDIKYAEQMITKSIGEMMDLLKKKSTNTPKTIQYFPRVNTTCQGICNWCGFRQLCHGVDK